MSSEPTTTTTAPARTYPSLRAAAIPLGALCLAFFVEMVDNTLMSIALPTIGRDLGGGTLSLQWVAAAYSVTFGGLLLTAGSAADRLGRRRVLLVGLTVFGVVIGLGLAALATPLLRSLLFGMSPLDPGTYLLMPAILAAVALLASYLPARRAAATEPMVVLRGE